MKIDIKKIQQIESAMLKETVSILNNNNITFYMFGGSVLGTVRHKGAIPWDTDMDIIIPLPQLNKAKKLLRENLSDRFILTDLDDDPKYKNLFPRVALAHTSPDTLHIDIFPLIGLPNGYEAQRKLCKYLLKKQKTFVIYKNMRFNIANPNSVKLFIGKMIEIFCSPFSRKQLRKQYYKILNRYPYETAEYVMNACGHNGEKNIVKKDVFGNAVLFDYEDIKVPIPEQWDWYLKHYYSDYMSFPPEEEIKPWLSFTLDIDDSDYETVKELLN
ncbi:MAG: LicD family protein [Clostridia bacterium]|nr:LicD family protein [Clostridia bacterium]